VPRLSNFGPRTQRSQQTQASLDINAACEDRDVVQPNLQRTPLLRVKRRNASNYGCRPKPKNGLTLHGRGEGCSRPTAVNADVCARRRKDPKACNYTVVQPENGQTCIRDARPPKTLEAAARPGPKNWSHNPVEGEEVPQAGAKKQHSPRVSGDGVGVISQGPYDTRAEPRARSGLEAGQPRDGSALRAADPHCTQAHKHIHTHARGGGGESAVKMFMGMLLAPGQGVQHKKKTTARGQSACLSFVLQPVGMGASSRSAPRPPRPTAAGSGPRTRLAPLERATSRTPASVGAEVLLGVLVARACSGSWGTR